MLKDRLKMLREHRGLSQVELAEALGLSAGGIGGYENGSRTPKPGILAEIAEFFNVPVEDLRDGPLLSNEQYAAFCERIFDVLDHTSSDDFEALGLDERAIRAAIRQSRPIREDRAIELAAELGTNIAKIIDGSDFKVKSLTRLSAYYDRFIAAATGADPEDIEDAIHYLEYKKASKK